MKIENICRECKKKKASHINLVAYYANGKPVYHKLCDGCMKTRWEDIKKELPFK